MLSLSRACFTAFTVAILSAPFHPSSQTERRMFSESLGGGSGQIATLLTQLEQIGVFDKVAGVLLGTFTNYEKEDYELSVYDLLKMHITDTMPVAYTKEIGHGHDSKGIMIGEKLKL